MTTAEKSLQLCGEILSIGENLLEVFYNKACSDFLSLYRRKFLTTSSFYDIK